MLCVSHREIEDIKKEEEEILEDSQPTKWQSELQRLSGVLQALRRSRSRRSSSSIEEEEEEEVEDNTFDVTENRKDEEVTEDPIKDAIVPPPLSSSSLSPSASRVEPCPLISGFCLQVKERKEGN